MTPYELNAERTLDEMFPEQSGPTPTGKPFTSLQFARITGRQHKNIVRDLCSVLAKTDQPEPIPTPDTFTYKGPSGRNRTAYRFGVELAVALLGQFNVKARYRIVRHMFELEKQVEQRWSANEGALGEARMTKYHPVAPYRVGQRLQELEAGAGKASKVIAQPLADKNPSEHSDTRECHMNTLTIANTAIRTDAEGRYCLNDLHRAAVASGVTKDIRPNEWMALSRTTELAESLIAENRRNTPISTSAGRYGGTYVARELVYDYAMWISPAFQLRVIRAYDAMVRQGVTASREGANGNEELESRVAALEAKEAERAATGREYASISAMRHKYGYPFSWEDLKEVSLQHGLRIRTMSNGKCGYHRLAWLEAYGIEL